MGTPHVLDAAIAELEAAIAAGQMPRPHSDDVWVYNRVGDGAILLVGHGDNDGSDWITVRIIGEGAPGRRVWVDCALQRRDLLTEGLQIGSMLRESWDLQVEQLARQASVVDIFVNGAPRSITNPRGVLNLPKP